MSNETVAVARVPREAVDEIVGSMAEGEREVVMLVALTENLSSLTRRLVGDDSQFQGVVEHMIRQLGEAAVAGCAEHFSITDGARFNELVAAAYKVIDVTRAAATAAIKESADEHTQH